MLSYIKVEPSAISGLERDVKLNDQILRALILRGDHLNEDRINASTPVMKIEEAQATEAAAKAAAADTKPETTGPAVAVAEVSSNDGDAPRTNDSGDADNNKE